MKRYIQDLGFKMAQFPRIFLGIPLFTGVNKTNLWNQLIENYTNKTSTWKGKCLISVGKNLILREVITTIPTYSMSCLKLPSKVGATIEHIMRFFFWCGNSNQKRV